MTDPLSADLAQALRDLGRAGKIASDWLPGMLVDFVPGQRETHPLSASSYPRRITSRSDIPSFLGQRDGEIVVGPVVDDPATLGCLLALVREAHGDPGMHAVCARDRSHWWVYYCGGFGPTGFGPTEAHALLAALRAAMRAEAAAKEPTPVVDIYDQALTEAMPEPLTAAPVRDIFTVQTFRRPDGPSPDFLAVRCPVCDARETLRPLICETFECHGHGVRLNCKDGRIVNWTETSPVEKEPTP